MANSSNGLPHYKNSTVSMSMYEPVYLNLFEVIITPPNNIDKEKHWNLVLEEVKKITGLSTDQMSAGAAVTQSYKGAKRRFAGALPDNTTVDISIEFEVNVDNNNSLIAYKGLRDWCDLIWNPLTGSQMLKTNYTGGPMTVTLHDKENTVIREWVFPTIWPTDPLNAMDLDYSAGANVYSVTAKFAADYWEDVTV